MQCLQCFFLAALQPSSLPFQMWLLFPSVPSGSLADSPSCFLADLQSLPLTLCQANGWQPLWTVICFGGRAARKWFFINSSTETMGKQPDLEAWGHCLLQGRIRRGTLNDALEGYCNSSSYCDWKSLLIICMMYGGLLSLFNWYQLSVHRLLPDVWKPKVAMLASFFFI